MTKRMTFPPLTGGLDLARLDAGQMESRRSPEMKNLWWEDGMLRSRPGQVRLLEGVGQGRAAYEEDFHGWGFFHIGESLYCADLAQPAYILLRTGLGTAAGTFFRYGEHLYYKTAGHFLRIRYTEEGSPPFAAGELAEEAYVPTILMNAHPATGAGDLYEQENRLTGKLRVLFTPDGETSCYRLPLTALAAVEAVTVNGAAADYTADLAAGTVTFAAAPEGEANSVAITFRRSNPAAYDAVMTCRAAAVCLAGTEVCMVLGGSAQQPNAVFWNGNGGGGMQDAYFPMACYNLCGDSAEAVTGFGRQYDQLMVLKSGSIGRLTPTLETLEGKTVLALTYEGVHSGIGCDLPRTIALVENNLVFCNARLGVQRLLSASAAYENNLQCISAPVHGGADRSGLLAALAAGEAVAFDDGRRCWFAADGKVFLWDYAISTAADPAWFLFTNIDAAAFLRWGENVFHLGRDGSLNAFRPTLSDFGAGIEKVYRFPALSLGGYRCMKDVTEVLLTLHCGADSDITLDYETDWGAYTDPITIRGYTHRLVPRNLALRCLGLRPFAHVVRRRPPAKDVRHFAMGLRNALPGQDLGIVGAEVAWRETRREK